MKWALTRERLADLVQQQAHILDAATALLSPEGCLAYATCSLLRQENEDQIDAFLQRHPAWGCDLLERWPVSSAGDGFFLALLKR